MTTLSVAVSGQALLHGAIDLSTPGADQVRAVLTQSDAAIVNLEATLETDGTWPTKTKTLHLTNADGMASLRALGFNGLTHANNHAFDLGPPGIVNTRFIAESQGFQFAGSGIDRRSAARVASIATSRGPIAFLSVDLGPQPDIVYASVERAGINPLRVRRKVSVPPHEFETLRTIVSTLGDDRREAARAAVGYRSDLPNAARLLEVFGTEVSEGQAIENRFEADRDDLAALEKQLAEARATSAIVAVALHNHHWDPDWSRSPAWVLDLSRQLLDMGADLVFGTGAPVLQGVAFHRNKPILAGLGNLIFHTRRSDTYDRQGVDVWTGAVCRCVFDVSDRACTRLEILPVTVGRPAPSPGASAPAPTPLDEHDAERVFEAMTKDLSAEDRARVVRLDPRALASRSVSTA